MDQRPSRPPTRALSVMRAMTVPALIAGCIGLGAAIWLIMSYGGEPLFAYLRRAGQNPGAHAPSTVGGVAQTSFTFYPGMTRIPESATPDLSDRSFTIAAFLEIPEDGATGMIITQGGLVAGWAFYVRDGKPVFHYNMAGAGRYTIAAERPLTPGPHTLMFAFSYDGSTRGGGTGTILADGQRIAQGRIERTIARPAAFDEGLDIGEDTGTPVNRDYDVPFKFTGKIARVTVGWGLPPTLF
jgi:arylsulfatase